MARYIKKQTNMAKREVKFVFDNEKAAKHFIVWLTEGGEQNYQDFMRYREEEEDGDITAVDFDYWGGIEPAHDAKLGDFPILAKCGRLGRR
jgi:hypothetical protein